MSLTKSLHTVTAVVRVAEYVREKNCNWGAVTCVDAALRVLGYEPKGMKDDPTYIACIKAFNKETA